MTIGMAFPICSLFYNILLLIAFYSKKRLDVLENKTYSILIVSSLIGVALEVICITVTIMGYVDSIYSMFIYKSYVVAVVLWIYIFSVYTFIISFKSKAKDFENLFKKILRISVIYILLIIVIIYILPLHAYYENAIMYTYGPCTDFAYLFGIGIFAVLWIVMLISNFKKIKQLKYLPLFIFIVLFILAAVIQASWPQITLMSTAQTFVTFLMYFTIENPDMKLINELNIAREQAEKANSAKTDFLSNMSHEIRTPLNAIMGFSQALANEDIPADAKDEVKDIVMASENLLDIVNGILDISKIEANKLEIINTEYNIYKAIDELVALTRGRLNEKPLDFRVNIDPSLPTVLFGDHVRLKQIVLNLLTNSVKYTKEGYVEFKVSGFVKNDICRLIFSIEDSGIGIKKENIDKLFQKFERFHEHGNTSIEGTGLGLAITKKLVELMNGQIVVQSVFGKGSRFTVAINQRIIAVNETVQENNAEEISDETIDLSNKKVLIVDDNKLNLKVASRLLVNYKMQITESESGFDCLDRIIGRGESYDLILLDDMMPKMSGIETLKKLKEKPGFNIPTVALTANAISGMREKYLAEGFDDYLPKPIVRQELSRVINKYLNK